ncbi:MAG: hypothetical protein H0T62_05715 [Parachlamydiaceae bacterium]|nr:hypothetical protein [Parachlamydiaceae bacterium]
MTTKERGSAVAPTPSSKKPATANDPTSQTGPTPLTQPSQTTTGPKTRITIRYDVGFSNALYLRGSGAHLSWEKGVLLKNLGADLWFWETSLPFTSCEFKVLMNDKEYEIGNNHILSCGATVQYTPMFSI